LSRSFGLPNPEYSGLPTEFIPLEAGPHPDIFSTIKELPAPELVPILRDPESRVFGTTNGVYPAGGGTTTRYIYNY